VFPTGERARGLAQHAVVRAGRRQTSTPRRIRRRTMLCPQIGTIAASQRRDRSHASVMIIATVFEQYTSIFFFFTKSSCLQSKSSTNRYVVADLHNRFFRRLQVHIHFVQSEL
jgi:hypothetical protein